MARGPALIIGVVLVVAGLFFIYRFHGFPHPNNFPGGSVREQGKAFFGIFGVNGWSGELTVAAGALLLFGAAQHVLAKTASLVVGVVLAVVGIIALVHHHSALDLFAANVWMIILWFAAAAALFINTLAPRTAGTRRTTVLASREPVVPVAGAATTRRGRLSGRRTVEPVETTTAPPAP